MTKKAFTLAEILIMVAILGILASLVIPTFQSHAAEAKEAAAKDNLRILRNAIELYAAQHNGIPPGYLGNIVISVPHYVALRNQLTNGYLTNFPANPFNDLQVANVLPTGSAFPEQATGAYGWIYNPSLKAIKLDWPGIDSQGVNYFDY